jgi:hypothetical protein
VAQDFLPTDGKSIGHSRYQWNRQFEKKLDIDFQFFQKRFEARRKTAQRRPSHTIVKRGKIRRIRAWEVLL